MSKLSEIPDPEWKRLLAPELDKPIMQELFSALTLGYKDRVIYPRQENIYAALKLCSLSQTKVVILGQDPYHGPDQAHGLAFSVTLGSKVPPSLRNIYEEINNDLGRPSNTTGDLTSWATQGVLLLNTVLTVEAGEAGSHQGWGWEHLTDIIIRLVSADSSPKVFILWGKAAQAKQPFINKDKHLIITSVHPSPLSAYRGFFGSKPFSQANDFLIKSGRSAINW